MTPKARALHRLADALASECYAELKSIIDWLEGVGYDAPVGLPPSAPDLETYVRHLREACYQLHDTLEEEGHS